MINSKYTIISCYINKPLYAVNLRNESSFFCHLFRSEEK